MNHLGPVFKLSPEVKEQKWNECYKLRETYLGNPVAMQKRSIISLELQYLLKITFQTNQQQGKKKIKEKKRKDS